MKTIATRKLPSPPVRSWPDFVTWTVRTGSGARRSSTSDGTRPRAARRFLWSVRFTTRPSFSCARRSTAERLK